MYTEQEGEIMKTATYRTSACWEDKDAEFTVEYDETAPCKICKEPVENASMGGTDICPACDCGLHRDTHEKWTLYELILISRDGWTPKAARKELAPR